MSPPMSKAGLPEPEGQGLSKPTVKQHLAALRMLFDWLVVGHVHRRATRRMRCAGRNIRRRKARRRCSTARKRGRCIAAIDTSSLTGLRDRALIGVMIYTFARVGAVLQMNVGDYFSQGRRGWVRLHEKGGKEHEAPCIPKLETYLDEYIAAAGIAERQRRAAVPHHGALDRHAAPDDATGRLPDDPAAGKAGGHQNPHRQSLHAGNRHHRLPEK